MSGAIYRATQPISHHSTARTGGGTARTGGGTARTGGGATSWPAPLSAVAGEHVVGLLRPPLTGPVEVRRAACPEPLQRVDHPPGRLDLLAAREQRGVADQHIEDQPLVRLRRGLGERLAVEEVHRD